MRGRARIEHNQVDLPGLSLSDEELGRLIDGVEQAATGGAS